MLAIQDQSSSLYLPNRTTQSTTADDNNSNTWLLARRWERDLRVSSSS
jgi:hypothetical protein